MKKSKSSQTSGSFRVTSMAALRDYVTHKPESIVEISCDQSSHTQVKALCDSKKVSCRVKVVTDLPSRLEAKINLEMLSEAEFLDDISGGGPPIILALDHVQDPRNFGAIVRTAAFYGYPYVLVPKVRQSLLTNASVATAQGGFAFCKAVYLTKLGRTLLKLKDAGYWIFGAAADGEPLKSPKHYVEKSVLVMGGEEKGMSAGVVKKCDFKISAGPENSLVDSLNVSVATGILVNEFFLLHQKHSEKNADGAFA